MANIKKDNNSIPCIAGLLNTNGTTITLIKANPTNHLLDISDAETGDDNGGTSAIHDENDEKTMIAASSSDETPVSLYADSDGKLLIKST